MAPKKSKKKKGKKKEKTAEQIAEDEAFELALKEFDNNDGSNQQSSKSKSKKSEKLKEQKLEEQEQTDHIEQKNPVVADIATALELAKMSSSSSSSDSDSESDDDFSRMAAMIHSSKSAKEPKTPKHTPALRRRNPPATKNVFVSTIPDGQIALPLQVLQKILSFSVNSTVATSLKSQSIAHFSHLAAGSEWEEAGHKEAQRFKEQKERREKQKLERALKGEEEETVKKPVVKLDEAWQIDSEDEFDGLYDDYYNTKQAGAGKHSKGKHGHHFKATEKRNYAIGKRNKQRAAQRN